MTSITPFTSLQGRLKVPNSHIPCFHLMSADHNVQMHDGRTIPQFGLGVYEMTDRETHNASKWALESGYRHIDTAEWYGNESQCGKAIAEFLREIGGSNL